MLMLPPPLLMLRRYYAIAFITFDITMLHYAGIDTPLTYYATPLLSYAIFIVFAIISFITSY